MIFEISKKLSDKTLFGPKEFWKLYRVKHQSRFFSKYLSLQIKIDEDLLLKKAASKSDFSQKQPPEVFYKKEAVLKISQYSQENAGLQTSNYLKKRLQPVLSCEYFEIFKNAYFDVSGHDQLLC